MAQLGLKQLDSVLTGSLQVSGSSGVTGSLSVSEDVTVTHVTASGNLKVDGTGTFGSVVATTTYSTNKGESTGNFRVLTASDIYPTSGQGLELMVNAGTAHVLNYNRTADTYHPLYMDGSTVGIRIGGSNKFTIYSAGNAKFSGDITGSGNFELTGANKKISGSATSTGSFGRVTATTFSGDGSAITGVTAEWDGSHTGTATFIGNVTASGVVSASGGFVGDGSGLTGITAEWDGTHVGDARISGSLILSGSLRVEGQTIMDSLDINTKSLIVSGAMELVDQSVGSAIASASFSIANLGTFATRDSAGVIDLGEGFN